MCGWIKLYTKAVLVTMTILSIDHISVGVGGVTYLLIHTFSLDGRVFKPYRKRPNPLARLSPIPTSVYLKAFIIWR
jgi:hypothetical protein